MAAPADRKQERMTLSVASVGVRDSFSLRPSRPAIVLTLEASIVDVLLGGRERVVVDRTGFMVAPKGTTITITSRMPSSRIAVLEIDPALVTETARRYRKLGFDRARLERWLTQRTLIARTVWIHEIAHRYVFERHALEQHDNLATRCLEVELLKELYYALRDRDDGKERESFGQKYSAPVERAIAFIETHLFEPARVRELVRHAGASESTLLRSFQRELGCGPGEYWRTRRLDEAMIRIRTGRHSIAEVAERCGYENATSFGFAFRKRFGRPPSVFQKRTRTKRAP